MKKFYERYWQGSSYNELRNDYKNDFHYKWPVIEKYLPRECSKILDFGCGNGIILKHLRQFSPRSKFIGVDISKAAIKKARKRNPGVEFFRVDDGSKLPLKDKSINLIFAGDVIEHVYDTENMFKEFYRILKTGGKIFITTPYYGTLKNLLIVIINFELVFDPKGPHIRFFTKKSLITMLNESGFVIDKVGYYGRFFPLSNGIYVIAFKSTV